MKQDQRRDVCKACAYYSAYGYCHLKRMKVAAYFVCPEFNHMERRMDFMANDGWFKCDRCGDCKKILVPDWKKELDEKCSCGGTYRKT